MRRPLVFAGVLGLAVVGSGVNSRAADIPSWQPPRTGIGYEVDLDHPPGENPTPIRSPEVRGRGPQPLYVRIAFSGEAAASESGGLSWERLDQTVDRFRDAGFEVILAPRGGAPGAGSRLPAPGESEALESWKKFLRGLAERYRGRVRFYQIGDLPDREGTLPAGAGAREYAFLFKTGAVEIRGADPDSLIVLGSIGAGRLEFLEAVLREDLGPYLDAVALRGETRVDTAAALEKAGNLILQQDPSAALWLVDQPLIEEPATPATTAPVSTGGTPLESAPAPAPAAEGPAPVEPAPIPDAPDPAANPGGSTPSSGAPVAPAAPSGEPPPEAPAAPPPPASAAPPPGGGVPGRRSGDLIRVYASALTAGARLVLFNLRRGPGGEPEQAAPMVLLRRLFPPSLGPAPDGTSKIRFTREGAEAPLVAEAWKFFDASSYQAILVYRPTEDPGPEARVRILLDTADVTGAAIDDLIAVSEKPPESAAPDAASGTTRIVAPLAAYPLLLRYQRFATPGFVRGPDETEVGGKGELSAEEIIARHQEFQADQDRRLNNVRATGRIRYLYRVAAADVSIDITTLNNFYWDPKTGGEWEQTDFLFNGVRWTGKKLPDLPLIQPEKVVILPLDIHLDKDYAYRSLGTDTADGRECYLLEFTPAVEGKNLYRGRVWIDRKSFARVRLAVVQTGMQPPVISNDERDTYGPAPGAGERPLWILQRIDGQQVWNISGVNLVVQREVEFENFVINGADFEEKRAAAYASRHTMLRDTEEGFRYLDRTETGERVVRSTQTKRTVLAAAGAYYDQSLDYPVPLAGIDYFDFNFRNSGAQVNAFFAGALLQASIQDPEFLARPLDAGASVLGVAFTSTDYYYLGDDRLDENEVRTRAQSLSLNLGLRLGNFFKLKALGLFDFIQYGGSDQTDTFVVPEDSPEMGYGLQGEFNRWGVSVQARTERHRRSGWEEWGDTTPGSPAVGTRLIDFDPAEESYVRTGALVSKQFLLPKFQKAVIRAEYLTGDRQDRFSKYTFGFFNNRVRGFAGSGIRFDRGVIASAGYGLNFAEIFRVETTLDYARVRDTQIRRLDPASPAGGDQDFAGFGIAGNVMGPWNSLIRFDWGIAVKSDVPGLAGDQEVQFAFLWFF